MNRTQGAYLCGRGIVNYYDIFGFAVAATVGYNSLEGLERVITTQGVTEGDKIQVALEAGIALSLGFYVLSYGRARLALYSQNVKNKKAYPLEHAERIFIEDREGLEFLLEETAAHKTNEWGTLLNAYKERGRTIIYEIAEPHICKQEGFIGEGTRSSLPFDFIRANEAGYKGYHHYHPNRVGPPWFGAANFAISFFDKIQPKNWINLLTFNMPEGPEIVGFNRQYTYIPVDASKRKLMRATPKQIMEYLRA